MKALHYGDNLQVLRDSIATESVDLIYLDPPFNSNAHLQCPMLEGKQTSVSGGLRSAFSHNRTYRRRLSGIDFRRPSG